MEFPLICPQNFDVSAPTTGAQNARGKYASAPTDVKMLQHIIPLGIILHPVRRDAFDDAEQQKQTERG